MSTSKQAMNSKLAFIFAGTLAVTNAALTSPSQAQGRVTSVWDCYLQDHGSKIVDRIQINWGHTEADAAWACNNWNSECGNNGGCFARQI